MLTMVWFLIAALLFIAPLKLLPEDTAAGIYFAGFGVFGFPLCLVVTGWAYHEIILPAWAFVYDH